VAELHGHGARRRSYAGADALERSRHKPRVASNDEALGASSRQSASSKFWKETAIFVIEDDAQKRSGSCGRPSHSWAGDFPVDQTRRGGQHDVYDGVDGPTMELILGLPPMTQFDAAATPMFYSFTASRWRIRFG